MPAARNESTCDDAGPPFGAHEPSVVDPQDVGMLEDLVVAACNDARAKADAMSAEETQKLMGGLGLPPGLGLPGGFKLPF